MVGCVYGIPLEGIPGTRCLGRGVMTHTSVDRRHSRARGDVRVGGGHGVRGGALVEVASWVSAEVQASGWISDWLFTS